MIYDIRNKEVTIIVKDEKLKLPNDLQDKINENFENLQRLGRNVWNGEVLCVSECNIDKDVVEIVCKKSNYAHYLYGEEIGCEKKYECKNLSAGALIETADGYYMIGELDDMTSYPGMLQVTGGGVDKRDIIEGKINVEYTIMREAREELNFDFKDKEMFLYEGLSYMYITEEDEQPGVQIFAKVKTKMIRDEFKKHFENYYKYLSENNMELELKKLYFLEKEKAVLELNKFSNPKRKYLEPLIKIDLV